jgi:hypothetical protein
VADIVISENIVERDFKHSSQKRKVLGGHISTGKDKIQPRETGGRVPVVQDRFDTV